MFPPRRHHRFTRNYRFLDFPSSSDSQPLCLPPQEPDNRRFDVLQDLDDPSKFALLEVYSTSEGNDAHRDLPHSKAWREGVKDWMAEKRTWSVYKPVYPWAGLWGTAAASRRAKDGVQQPVQAAFLTLDKDGDTAGAKAAAEDTKQITHVHVTCKPGTEDEFIEACLANAASSVLEPDNLRFDVLRHRDEPNKFMLVEVYATSEGPVAHKATPHYNEWRTTVEPFMQEPRRARKFRAVFPTDPGAWKMTLNDN